MYLTHFKLLAIPVRESNLKKNVVGTVLSVAVLGVSANFFKEGAYACAHNQDGVTFSDVAITIACLILVILSSFTTLASGARVVNDVYHYATDKPLPKSLEKVVVDEDDPSRPLLK